VEGINILYTMTLHIVNSFFRTFVNGTLVEILFVLVKRSHPPPFHATGLAFLGIMRALESTSYCFKGLLGIQPSKNAICEAETVMIKERKIDALSKKAF